MDCKGTFLLLPCAQNVETEKLSFVKAVGPEILKDVGLKLISELMKNSRISDREMAKRLGVSQPTVSRVRAKLEKQGYIREYTAVPDFVKLGYQLVFINLVKVKKGLSKEEMEKARQISQKDMAKNAPDEIVLFSRGIGDGYTGVMIAFHKSYSDFRKLVERMKEYPFVDVSATLSFLVDLNDEVQYRQFTFSTLAKHVLTLPK
jgi:DNA-binding Lrp family transcriptional regulator